MLDTESHNGVTVRPRREEDLNEAARILVTVHEADGYPVEGVDRPEQWLNAPGMISAWVAELDGHIVGHVAVGSATTEEVQGILHEQRKPVDNPAFLMRLFVSPATRRRSIGERLVATAVDFAEAQGLSLILDVMAKDEAAIRLYERLGWRQIGESSHSFGDDEAVPAFWYLAPER
ncbi:N-acetyltransferase family protein [Streptomyces xiamenensis]|uniref:GNAT family N-acetyltransferase n=1 Tax=Streptomyces xiamenensis TaxID=408015 RepID=UPI003D7456CF